MRSSLTERPRDRRSPKRPGDSKRLAKRFLLLGAVLVVACAQESVETSFGSPASAEDATRVIEVVASDDFTFEPAEYTVTEGEIVTFRIVNRGQIPHDFTLGDEAAQEEHAEAMAEGDHAAHDSPNAVVIDPGEIGGLTWAFTQPGTVLIGCHQPGHYPAGMRATITVTKG